MQNNKPSSSNSRRIPTVTGAVLFTVFNLVILSLLACLLLELWCVADVVIHNTEHASISVTNIINHLHQHVRWPYVERLLERIHATCKQTIGSATLALVSGACQIVALRIMAFMKFLPFLTVILFVAVTDGLVQRDIRKFQCARESAFRFHRLLAATKMFFFSMYFVWLVLPIYIEPQMYFVPAILAFGIFVMLTIKYFRKYL